MENTLDFVENKANSWLKKDYDKKFKLEILEMLNSDDKAKLIDAFYRELEFGTGGMRGIMGAGSNRMNKYTVGAATQGLSNYIKKEFKNKKEAKVVIAHDCRNNSRYFSELTAKIFQANGFETYLFEDLRPTPELSFAIRELGCLAGVVITASHNPPEYNGYKVYWNDGAQLVAPHDKNIITEVGNITEVKQIKFDGNIDKVKIIGKEIDEKYIAKVKELSLSPKLVKKNNDIKIVYTPIHGTGITIIPRALKEFGFTNVHNVPEQDEINGNFPTVVSPNPEETEALTMALNKAKKINADVVFATDPDSDRVGMAAKNQNNEYILFNGNQTSAIITYYLLTRWKELCKIKDNEYIINTIVSSSILEKMAEKFNVGYYEVFTGFKNIAEVIRENEGKKTYIGGGEESYGYLVGDFVRDKDAVSSICILSEIFAWAKEQNKTIFDILIDLSLEFGLYQESLVYFVKKGKDGAEAIKKMMENYRNNPPEKIIGQKVTIIKDFQEQKLIDKQNNKISKTHLKGTSNVLQYILEDGSKISIRPSGTEPKIKYYFSANTTINSRNEFESKSNKLMKKLEEMKTIING